MANAETNHCRGVEPRRGASRRNLGTRVGHHNHKSTSNSIATNRLYLTKHHTHCVISEQTPAAFRRTPKGRRQAESRHSSKVSSPNASRLQIGCEAVLCKALAPPNPKKLPQAHPPQRKRNKSLLCPGGCAWGSSRRKREVWRERDPSFKRGPSPFKVFPLLPPRSFPPYPRFFSPKKLDKRGEKGYNKSV